MAYLINRAELQSLEADFNIEVSEWNKNAFELWCKKCTSGFELDRDKKLAVGSLLKMINHARSHK